ncbi:MAG: ferredoxin family protein [Anaerolineales bacterium]|jgi:NAD-dependent dihydropyrimidine dehydrogenase PreA subunit
MQPTFWSSITEHLEIAKKLRGLEIRLDTERCKGVWQCYNVCPVGCWTPDYDRRKVVLHDMERCIACGACVLQCPEDAIELK